MKTPKISIIVPVYNVEPYIRRCIDSILSQTFKDFELILVDDGSPDRCGEICEEYAIRDSRIKVIYKENGGQLSARNRGLDIAQGDYIGFVDSDDWIDEDMYEILYNLCKNNDAQIANIGINFINNNKIESSKKYELIALTKYEAMKILLEYKTFGDYFWANLFERKLFENLRFEEGIIYEDVDLFYKLIDRADKRCY